jgi:outer membrane protein
MKKTGLILSVFVLVIFASVISAQPKIGYVDSDTIMKQLADYQDTQKKLDALIKEWQEEIAKMERDHKAKFEDYQKKRLILSEQKRVDTEKELVDLENQISKYRQEKLGVRGELFQKQEELMKPINNRIFTAIQEVAKEKDYDFIFDRSGDMVFLYAKEQYDVTQLVLEKLK